MYFLCEVKRGLSQTAVAIKHTQSQTFDPKICTLSTSINNASDSVLQHLWAWDTEDLGALEVFLFILSFDSVFSLVDASDASIELLWNIFIGLLLFPGDTQSRYDQNMKTRVLGLDNISWTLTTVHTLWWAIKWTIQRLNIPKKTKL